MRKDADTMRSRIRTQSTHEWLNDPAVGKTRNRRKKTNEAVVLPEEGMH
jgi:hypothetical protein